MHDVNQLTMFGEDELAEALYEMETGETTY